MQPDEIIQNISFIAPEIKTDRPDMYDQNKQLTQITEKLNQFENFFGELQKINKLADKAVESSAEVSSKLDLFRNEQKHLTQAEEELKEYKTLYEKEQEKNKKLKAKLDNIYYICKDACSSKSGV